MNRFINYSLLNDRTENEGLNQELSSYRLSLIRNALAYTRFSKVDFVVPTKSTLGGTTECMDQLYDVLYSCSDKYEKLGRICICQDKKKHVFMLILDDRLYDHVDLLMMDIIGLSMDQFCKKEHKSLEDLVEHLTKIIFCLPTT